MEVAYSTSLFSSLSNCYGSSAGPASILEFCQRFPVWVEKIIETLGLGDFFPPDCRGEMMFYIRVKQPSTPAKKDHVPSFCWVPWLFNWKTLLVIWPLLVIATPTSFSIRTTWLQHEINMCIASQVVVSGWKLLFTHHSVLVFPAGRGMLILSV